MDRFKALRRSRQIIIGIVAAAILGCCGIVGLAAILPSDEEPTRSQAVTESKTTNQPTDTLIPPINTPIPPTDTLQPADTPVPTDTPAPTDTAVPTDTPQPTSTPLPTPTQGPTRTPRPTNTPEPPTVTPVPPTEPPAATATTEPTQPPQARVIIANVFNQSYTEHVEITNKGDGPADMSGWFVHGSKGDEVFTFPDGYILGAGATMRLHSGENGVDAPPSDIYWTDKTVWNNQGETVYLKDAQGTLVDQYSY